MSDSDKYTRSIDYNAQQTNEGQVQGASMNIDFDNLANAYNNNANRLDEIRRSDSTQSVPRLNNTIVTLDSLGADVLALITLFNTTDDPLSLVRGEWVTARDYSRNDIITTTVSANGTKDLLTITASDGANTTTFEVQGVVTDTEQDITVTGTGGNTNQTLTEVGTSGGVSETGTYICLTDHTSDDFQTDLDNGLWFQFAGNSLTGIGTAVVANAPRNVVVVTGDLDVSAGFIHNTFYQVRPVAEAQVTITIPDATTGGFIDGFVATFHLDLPGSILVKTPSTPPVTPIEGETDLVIAADQASVSLLASTATAGYQISQDSRPKPSAGITLFATTSADPSLAGYVAAVTDNDDVRYDDPSVTVTTPIITNSALDRATAEITSRFIADAGVVGDLLNDDLIITVIVNKTPSNAKDSHFFSSLYIAVSPYGAANETLIQETATSGIVNETPTEHLLIFPNVTVDIGVTDRLVIKTFGFKASSGGVNPAIEFPVGGKLPSDIPARINIPQAVSSISHNATGGLQGGTTDEFFHMTAAQSAAQLVNVLSFGATGLGITDDTAAIQAAIDDFSAAGILYFPPGTYLISSPLEILTESISLLGAGGSSIIKSSSGSAFPQTTDTTQRTLIYFKDVDDWVVNNLSFDHNITTSDGSNILAANNCDRLKITDCWFDGGNFAAVSLNSCEEFLVHGNSVVNNGFPKSPTLATGGVGIYIAGTSRHGTVSSNSVETSFHGIGTAAGSTASDVVFIGNSIRNCSFSGLEIDDGSRITCQGNVISTADKWTYPDSIGIIVDSSADVLVEGNTIFEVALHGVHVIASSTGTRVNGNVIKSFGQSGIFANSSDTNITDNYISIGFTIRLTLSSVSGSFTEDTTVEDTTTGATGVVDLWDSANGFLHLRTVSGLFTVANICQLQSGGPPSGTIDAVDYLGDGIRLSGANQCVVDSNSIFQVMGHGIALFSADNNLISNNLIKDANKKDNGFGGGSVPAKAAIYVNADIGLASDANRVQGNKSVGTSSTWYGIHIPNSNANNTWVIDNDFVGHAGSGNSVSDSGTATVFMNNIDAYATAFLTHNKGLDFSGSTVKNLTNSAASALSGTQKDIEIDIGGTSYFFTVFPTKA